MWDTSGGINDGWVIWGAKMWENTFPAWPGPRSVFLTVRPGGSYRDSHPASADKSDTALLIVNAVLPSARDLRLRPRSGFGSCAGGATACWWTAPGAGDPGQSGDSRLTRGPTTRRSV